MICDKLPTIPGRRYSVSDEVIYDSATKGTSKQRVILKGNDAVELWLQGMDAWNTWVLSNQVADVDFSGIDFTTLNVGELANSVSFSGFKFPRGRVDFSNTKFGDGHVDFSKADFNGGDITFFNSKFGEGSINFTDVKFGNGDVDFSSINFGHGNVDFSESSFDSGEVDFSESSFGNGSISFFNTKFSSGFINFFCTDFKDGDVNFFQASFGDGDVCFWNSSFGDGEIDFSYSTFGEGNIDFSLSSFGKGDIYFFETKFGKGHVNFSDSAFDGPSIDFTESVFCEGELSFKKAHFGESKVTFNKAKFIKTDVDFSASEIIESDIDLSYSEINEGSLFFNPLKLGYKDYNFNNIAVKGNIHVSEQTTSEYVKSISFQGTNFENVALLSGSFPCVIDLTSTLTKNHLDLSQLNCALPRRTVFPLIKKAVNPEDAARLCRLKELAEDNKHHEAALRFHADEMRAKRWHEFGFWASLLDISFSFFSNYGQSIIRPTISLFLLWVGLFCAYTLPSDSKTWWINSIAAKGGSSVEFILTNSLPFVSNTKHIRETSMIEIFGNNPPDWLNIITIGQGVISFILLFLIGLALRNRFRI